MKQLLERFSNLIMGCITGFDRIVFKGMILPLTYARGAMNFCRKHQILNKDLKKWMLETSADLVASADRYAREACGVGIMPLSSWRIRKEKMAHERQRGEQIGSGLIGVWSCLETGATYRAHFCAEAGYPQLKSLRAPCKHLYFYYDHEEYGFMSIRLQTWFPYPVQISLNGREWLRRQLEHQGIDFRVQGNKFLHIGDYAEAQRLLDSQLDTCWVELLDSFLPPIYPGMTEILGPSLTYYWTLWQSEWATDFIFQSPEDLKPIMDDLLRHALITGNSTRILRYMGRPLKNDGQPYANLKDEVMTRVMQFYEGLRVRHWVDQNSFKFYNWFNNLRAESTVNKPRKFIVYRHKQGEPPEAPKQRLPLRQGVADIPLRAQISQQINDRFLADLAGFHDETPLRDWLDGVTRARIEDGRRIRGLDLMGRDRELLQLISDPRFRVAGLTNKMLREDLQRTSWAARRTTKQISARISRDLRLLRDHGIIRKLPNQNRYQLTKRGVQLTTCLNLLLAASTEQLLKMAA